MDIRRLPLWEGRNVTYMTNDQSTVVIEDNCEVMLEFSTRCPAGGLLNSLCLPYYRGFGTSVLDDPNAEWYDNKQTLYQAGGSYFTFPYASESITTSNNAYWLMRRYGTEENWGGVWRYSTMKSREEDNRYTLDKIDFMIPGENVVYTAIRMTNTGDKELLCSPSTNSMFSCPFIASGCLIDSNARHYAAYMKTIREVANNRFLSGPISDDLRRVPLVKGGFADASIVPPPTGTYDYLLGKIPENAPFGWTTVINPRMQMVYMTMTPAVVEEDEVAFPNVNFVENYLGRMDSPWSFWDGGTSQVFSLTSGFNFGPKGTRNLSIAPGEYKVLYYANAFSSFENPRMGLGFYTLEATSDGVQMKRTKSTMNIKIDTSFDKIRKLRKRVFAE